MPYETIENKKFMDGAGTGYLWTKIKNRYDSKLDEVRAADDSINVTNSNQISVAISSDPSNLLQVKTTGNKGLYVENPGSPDTYTIEADVSPGDYAAVYHLKKYTTGSNVGLDVGVPINIPKDMVVQSGEIVTKSTAGTWGPAGTYIELTLANASNTKLYIAVGDLVEYVTSGSQAGDMVFVTVNPTTHQVTAAITDGTITYDKLASSLQDMVSNGATAVSSVTEGTTNGTINVDGSDVSVHGLGTAAYSAATAFDAAGAASAVLGTSSDTAATATVYGVKKYASDAYAAILPLTTAEIDAAVAAAEQE